MSPGAPKPRQQFSAVTPALNPPIKTAQSVDVNEITDTLGTAKQLLIAATNAVGELLTERVAACRSDLTSCQQSIKQQLTDAVAQAYSTYASAGASVRDNLAYLMSAAVQYAGLLGYPPGSPDVPPGTSPQQATADVLAPGGIPQIIPGQPIDVANQTIVPRDVGWQSGDLGLLTQSTRPASPGPRLPPGGTRGAPDWTTPLPIGPGGAQAISPVIPPTPVVPTEASGGTIPESIAPVTSAIGTVGGGTIPGVGPSTPTTPGVPTSTGVPNALVSPVTIQPTAGLQREQLPPRAPLRPPPVNLRPGGATPPGVIEGQTPLALPPIGTPTADGCPTSTVGLPVVDLLFAGIVTPRPGLYFTDNTHSLIFVVKPQSMIIGSVYGAWTIDGVLLGGEECATSPGTIKPITPPLSPPPPIVETCEGLTSDKTNWTPWQLANCGIVSTMPSGGTATSGQCVPCPPAQVTIDLKALCDCLRGIVLNQFPVPVDLDQPHAFIFSPDDVEWKRNALAWEGKWLEDMNASADVNEFTQLVLKDYPQATDSYD